MTRLIGFVVYNWPLKLAAIALATLLYAGLVVSQSSSDFTGGVPITPVNQPADAFLLSNLPPVTRIRYLNNADGSAPGQNSFRATIDLAGIDPSVGSIYVAVKVEATDPRFPVLDFEPRGVNVLLDPLRTKLVPVTVKLGETPSGLDVRAPEINPTQVTVSGPASVVDLVVAAQADVVISPQGIFVDRDVPLVPVDLAGARKSPVNVSPTSSHIRIPVFSNSEKRTLAVNPVTSGTPPSGYSLDTITVDPVVVLVEGDPDVLAPIVRADTQPIPIGAVTGTLSVDVPLALPSGVLSSVSTVHVTISIKPDVGTKIFHAAVVPTGVKAGFGYDVSVGSVLVTVGGPVADLDRLDASAFTVSVNVTDLGPGAHELVPTANLQAGLRLLSIQPGTVTVTVTGPQTPAPS